MTNSCSCLHLNLSQSRVRLDTYRLSPFFFDDTFPSLLARPSVVGLAFSLDVLREPQGALEVEGIAKYFLSVPERNLPDVVAVQVEQVEKIEPHRHLANQISGGMFHLHARLQFCEIGDSAVERDNLAIRDEGGGFLLMNRLNQLGISPVQPNLVPRKKIQIGTAVKSEAAFPIPFRLK